MAAVETYLPHIDAAESMVRAQEERAAALRNAILAAAFSGTLVSQDPNDELASVLLERIAADRAASNGRTGFARNQPRRPRQKVSA